MSGDSRGAIELTYAEAIRHALSDAMDADPNIIVLGQDVVVGFPFGATRGLAERYGRTRVRDTPISEAGTMGCGVGAAMMGLRPVVEVDYSGFLFLAYDQLINLAAKLRYMSAGQLRVPLVLRVGQGPLGGFAAQHSQSQHATFVATPGLGVVAPSTPQDAYDAMRWSLVQNDPIVFAEDMRLYRVKGSVDRRPPQGPPQNSVVRRGRHATVLTFGFGVELARSAAERLAESGMEIEIVDLKLLSPLDRHSISDSCRRTRRVLCVADDPLMGGITATLAAVAQEEAGEDLVAPILRLGSRHTPVPFSPSLESEVFPTSDSVTAALERLLAL